MSRDTFSARLLKWYDCHGRKTLPWKRVRDPYRIWVSEIMLQQTQVTTIIPYFERFAKRFPDVRTLARARPDSVLHLWSGLGYYARARNLHKAAKRIIAEHGGTFPRELESVVRLPGIGRSTAGAILALAFDQRHAILDGNVKRVLARHHAIDAPPNRRETETKLWQLAERHTPSRRVADYTQAIMDLGATVCTRAHPDCAHCPVRAGCKARKLGTPQNFPVPAKRRAMPVKQVNMLLIRDARDRVLLVKRPPAGLWGGLWGLPECTQKICARGATITSVSTSARKKPGRRFATASAIFISTSHPYPRGRRGIANVRWRTATASGITSHARTRAASRRRCRNFCNNWASRSFRKDT